MTAYATKISVAFASDTPSGSVYSTGGDDQIIGKFVVTNSANAGNYSATIKSLNFTMSQSGTSKAIATVAQMKVYKSSVLAANLVANTIFAADDDHDISDTGFVATGTNAVTDTESNAAMGFEDVEIEAGQSQTFIVTLDTDDFIAADTAAESISIGMASDDILWRDGVIQSNINAVNTLPLSSKSINYPAS